MARRTKGFTLIELLIVVAIIAVLAAIAVPNFLEAHTRSKVTKTMTDMRAIALAVNMYIVDNNEVLNIYDRGNTFPLTFWLREQGGPEFMGNRLSTPVAYLSEVPWDHFNTIARSSIHNFTTRVAVSMHSRPLDAPGHRQLHLFKRYQWSLESFGPDLLYWNDAPGPSGDVLNKIFYDPTNGTISPGSIWYFDAWGFGHPFGSRELY